MGAAGLCGHDHGLDAVLNVVQPPRANDLPDVGPEFRDEWKGSYGGGCSSGSTEPGDPFSAIRGAASEVAEEIARDMDRQARRYDCSSLIPAHFDVKEAAMQDQPNQQVAVHRTTGMVRRLVAVQKPASAECQERLRSTVRRLQGLRSDGVARILEVFEDARAMSLIMEHCSGGTVYDRILQRQYFAEQESAVLVSHLLQSVSCLHQQGLHHGILTPDSWRFMSDQTHAPLKLVDFGLDLKVHAWEELAGPAAGSREAGRRTEVLQLLETCRIVFCAPEVVRPSQAPRREGARREPRGFPPRGGPLNVDLLAEAVDAHLEQAQGLGADDGALAAADAWSIGAIAFLLLCGYPPFFAPHRPAILARIEKTDFSFDPPFWSKISEEAKDFVQSCLRSAPGRRMTVAEALRHPWITSLADTSPQGSMLASFALNLRRFYRTSLIEAFTANSLADRLRCEEVQELLLHCSEADPAKSGFLTATDLRQILLNLGHAEIAEAIALCFSRTLRHPGESYVDYEALAESTRLRRERRTEEELFRCFRDFDAKHGVCDEGGRLPARMVVEFFEEPEVRGLLAREGVQESALLASPALQVVSAAVAADEDDFAAPRLDFVELATEVIWELPRLSAPPEGPG